MNRRWVRYVMAGGVALALAGCSGGSSGSTTASSSTTPVVASSTATPPPTTDASTPVTPSSSTSAPPAVDQVITIAVVNGKVTPKSDRVKVKKGSTVQLVVTSDIADEVHLHGYDKHVDVEKGGTAQLTFKASISGVFEVELEAKKLRLTQLQVA